MRPVLITGGGGTLGRAFGRLADSRGLGPVVASRAELDIADPSAIARALARHHPWAIVNTAGFVRVDDAEVERERCWRENVAGASCLATACADAGIALVVFSTDLVFDGTKSSPYEEDDRPAPLGVYGASKAAAEADVAARHPGALIVRTSAFFGPWDSHNFVHHALDRLARGSDVLAADAVVSPTYVPDLVQATLDLMVDGVAGLWHVTSGEGLSWLELARRVADRGGYDRERVRSATPTELGWRARRPQQSVLVSRHGQLLPTLDDALGRFFASATRA